MVEVVNPCMCEGMFGKLVGLFWGEFKFAVSGNGGR